ncbi:MAG TPA: thioredoxin family protein [Parasegetibacter sp.]
MKPILLVAAVLFASVSFAQQQPPHAEEVVSKAIAKAAKEKKNVFVIFHASWCGWCRKMDTAMANDACKKFFTDNYVIEHLTVQESEKNKNLENPGGNELYEKYGKGRVGLPFWIILDSKGNLIADAMVRPEGASLDVAGKNVGCPASEDEVEHFINVLKKTSRMKNDQLEIVRNIFRKNDPRYTSNQ